MINIIKNGKKPIKTKTIWTITCPECGCEFECELEDFKSIEKTLNGDKVINCPCCEKELHTKNLENIKTREEEIKEEDHYTPNPYLGSHDWAKDPNIYPPKYDPCETCPHKDGPKDGLGYPTVGDSMCQWCIHYKYRVVYTNATTAVNKVGDKIND